MAMRKMEWTLGTLALCAASLTWAGSANQAPVAPLKSPIAASAKSKPKASDPAASASGNLPAVGNLQGTASPEPEGALKPALADAFIAQNVLRVFLNRPAAVFVYNSRGQQVYHLDSQSPAEAVPLQGITTGFIYLTIRTAQGELTKKLVYTGK
ncbi:MAG: hypothetical protein JWP91_1827 [Fibrobacteres bacterium]|nr:hypothetical protein [Fibrobacterota bacterium]